MGTLRLFVACLLVTGLYASGAKPVKDIDIIVKKQPTGSSSLVRTDANGRFSIRIAEPGTYRLRLAARPDLPGLPGPGGFVRSSIQFLADPSPAAPSSTAKPGPRTAATTFSPDRRSSQKLLPLTPTGLYSSENIEFSGPGFFTGSLTSDRSLTSLDTLSYLAVEGQLSPLPQAVSVLAEGYSAFDYSVTLRPGIERRWRTQIEAPTGSWRGTGDKPEFRVALNTEGLPAGTYSDEVTLTLTNGDQSEDIRLPITIHVRPRGFNQGIQASRSTVVVPVTAGKLTRSFTLFNPTTADQTYSIGVSKGTAPEAFKLPAAPVRVRPGETVVVPIEIDGAALRDGGDDPEAGGEFVPQCVEVYNAADGSTFEYCTLPMDPYVPIPLLPEDPPILHKLRLLPVPPTGQKCVATKIYPIAVARPNRILQGLDNRFRFEVWDNCGLEQSDFTLQAFSSLGGTSTGKAVVKQGIATGITIPASGPATLQVQVRAGDLTGETTVDLDVEPTPVPAMKAVNKPGIATRARPQPAKDQAIAPGAIVEAESTPVSETGELLLNGRPVSILSRRGNVFTFRVPYNTDPALANFLQVRDGNHTSAPFPLPVVPASPRILTNLETGAASFLRSSDGSLVPVTTDTRAPAGSTLVVFAEGLGSAGTEPAVDNPTVILAATKSKRRAGIADGVGDVKVGLGKTPPRPSISPIEIALTRDLPIELEGRPDTAFRLTFILPEALESADPASGAITLTVESQSLLSEPASTYTNDPAPLSSVYVTSQASPVPATHLWDNAPQNTLRGANETVGAAHSLEGPTPQPVSAGTRLRLADIVSNLATNATAPDGNRWDFTIPNSTSQIDYTAVYEKDFQLTFQVNPPACGALGNGPLSSPDNWWAEGSTAPLTRTINPGWTMVSLIGSTTSNSVLMDRPRTVTMTCQQGFLVTLRATPTPSGTAPVRIDSSTNNNGVVNTVGNAAMLLTVPDGYLASPNYVIFSGTSTPARPWSQLPGPLSNPWSTSAPTPTGPITYTALYRPACVVLTPYPNMTLTAGTLFTRAGAPANCYTIGANVTLTATPPAGQCFVIWGDGNTTNPRVWPVTPGAILPRPLFGPCTKACVAAPAGPGAWWSMESATPPVLDRWPLGLHAVASTGALPTVVPGKVGNALHFNGIDQTLNVPYNAVFDNLRSGPSTGFTIDAWIKLDPAPGKDSLGILANNNVNGISGFGFGVDRANGPRLYLGAFQGSSGYETFGRDLPITDNDWHFVAVRFRRPPANAIPELTFWLDGVKRTQTTMVPILDLSTTIDYYLGCTTLSTSLCWSNPATLPGLPLAIGRSWSNTMDAQYHGRGAIDELEYFQRPLSDTEIESIYTAGDKGKCIPPAVRVTVNSNPAAVGNVTGASFGVAGLGSSSPTFSTLLPTGTSTLAVTAASPVTNVAAGIRYELQTLNTWSVNGTPNPKYSTNPQPVPVPSTDTTYTANYRTLFEVKVVIRGTCTVVPAPGFYVSGLQLPVTITPATGATATWAFTGGSLPVVSGDRIPILSPGTLTVNCAASASIPVLVLTNPPNIGATLTLAGLTPGAGNALNQYGANAVSGATGAVSTAPVQIFNTANTTRWDFKNWSGAGIAAPGLAPSLQPVVVQPTATTFTANYDTFYKVDVFNNGCASAVPVPGFYPAGSTLTVTVIPGSNKQITSLNFGTPRGGVTLPPIVNNSTVTVNGYKVVEAICSANPVGAITVNTLPAALGVTVGVTGSGAALNSFTAANLPVGPAAVTVNTLGPILTPPGQQYQLLRWFQVGGSVLGNSLSQAATVAAGLTTTYTAEYQLTGNRVTIVNNGCNSVGATPALPANGIWPVGTPLTGLSATPPTGGAVGNVAATILADPSTGQTINLSYTLPLSIPLTITTPWTFTFTCTAATTVGVTVNTSPANIGATVGVGTGSAENAFSATLPANSVQTLSATATAVVASSGLGYRFNNWAPAGPTVTLPASGTASYTANYTVACYLVFTEVVPAGSGTVTLSPASPVGLPTGCYPNGAAITATIVPAAGRLANGFLPGAAGSGGPSPYTFSLTGPTLLTATTTVAPVAAPNVNWAYVSRNGLMVTLRATNNGNAPANNLRATALGSGVTIQYANQPPLPRALGTLAAGASTTIDLLFAYTGESLDPNPNVAFQVALTSQADNLASSVSTIPIPAPPQTTVRLDAVSRTNSSNTGALVFRVTNTGPNPTLTLALGLQLTGPTGLTFTNTQSVAPLAPGATQQVTFPIALPVSQSMAAATLNATLQAGGNIPTTSARWRFDPPITIVALP